MPASTRLSVSVPAPPITVSAVVKSPAAANSKRSAPLPPVKLSLPVEAVIVAGPSPVMVTVSLLALPVTATVLVALPEAKVNTFTKLPRAITSAPPPPLTVVAVPAVVKVRLSTPVPPVMDSIVRMSAKVLAPLARINVSVPAPPITVPAVTAADSVMVSLPDPPVTTSTLVTVTLLVKLPRVRLSAPAPKSTVRPVTAAPIVMVCAVVPAAISVIDVMLVEEIVIVSLLAPLNSSTSTPLTDEATV